MKGDVLLGPRAVCARKCDVPAAYQSPMAHEGSAAK